MIRRSDFHPNRAIWFSQRTQHLREQAIICCCLADGLKKTGENFKRYTYLIVLHVACGWDANGINGCALEFEFSIRIPDIVHSAHTISGIAIVVGYSIWVRSISSYAVHSVLCSEPTIQMVEAKRLEDSDAVTMLATTASN